MQQGCRKVRTRERYQLSFIIPQYSFKMKKSNSNMILNIKIWQNTLYLYFVFKFFKSGSSYFFNFL